MAASPRVVIGDAVCATRTALARALRRNGYDVVEADDGAAILDYVGDCVEHAEPVVVVADSRMPVLTGLHVLASLRNLQSVRVIVTASYDDHRTHMLARKLGAAAMFDKPLDVARLCAAIDGIAYAQSAISAGLRS